MQSKSLGVSLCFPLLGCLNSSSKTSGYTFLLIPTINRKSCEFPVIVDIPLTSSGFTITVRKDNWAVLCHTLAKPDSHLMFWGYGNILTAGFEKSADANNCPALWPDRKERFSCWRVIRECLREAWLLEVTIAEKHFPMTDAEVLQIIHYGLSETPGISKC